MNTTNTVSTQGGTGASEAGLQTLIGPSGTTKLEPSGEIPATNSKPHLLAKAEVGFELYEDGSLIEFKI